MNFNSNKSIPVISLRRFFIVESKTMMTEKLFDEDTATLNFNYVRIAMLKSKLKGKLGSICFFKTSVLETIQQYTLEQ